MQVTTATTAATAAAKAAAAAAIVPSTSGARAGAPPTALAGLRAVCYSAGGDAAGPASAELSSAARSRPGGIVRSIRA